MEARDYKRLPGRGGRGALGFTTARCTLYLGKDHLLLVDATLSEERYKRFYYRDIEAILLRKNHHRLLWLTVQSLALFSSIGYAGAEGGLPLKTWVVVACLILFTIAVNWFMGPSVSATLQTATQLEELPSLRRLPTAVRALRKLHPLILEAQQQATGADQTEIPPPEALLDGQAPAPEERT